MHIIFKYFHIFLELDGLSLNQDIVASLMLKNSNGKIKFMVYNNVFWNYFFEFPDYKAFHYGWILLSNFCFALSVFFYYIYIDLIVNGRAWN